MDERNSIKRICVFCGSNPGARSAYTDAAQQLGKALVSQGMGLVYGGGGIGLMTVVADAVLEEKKKIIVVARTEGIEIIVEGEKDTDDYELLLSKTQAMELAISILNTLYKTGIKM